MKKGSTKYNFGNPKDNINKYMSEYMKKEYKCELCDKIMTLSGKPSHLKSNKHKIKMLEDKLKNIDNIENNN